MKKAKNSKKYDVDHKTYGDIRTNHALYIDYGYNKDFISGIYTSDNQSWFDKHRLYDYMASVIVDDRNTVFSKDTSNGLSFPSEQSIYEFLEKDISIRDLTLLYLYINIYTTNRFIYLFSGFYNMCSAVYMNSKIYHPLTEKGYIRVCNLRSDYPVLGGDEKTCMVITPKGLRYLGETYPMLYLPSSHLPSGTGNTKALHDIYTKLASMQIFAYLSSCDASSSISYEYLIGNSSRVSRYGKVPGGGANKRTDVRSDSFINTSKLRLYVETDMTTESYNFLAEKIDDYCIEGKSAYDGEALDTKDSVILFCTHNPNHISYDVDKNDIPKTLVMPTASYISFSYINDVVARLDALPEDEWIYYEDYISDSSIRDKFKSIAYDTETNNRLARIRTDKDMPFILACLDEIICFYCDNYGYEAISDALMAYGYSMKDRFARQGEYDSIYRSYGISRVYNTAYVSSIQEKFNTVRLRGLSKIYLDMVRYINTDNEVLTDTLISVMSGLSMWCIPNLSLGRYMGLLPNIGQDIYANIASSYDMIMYGAAFNRTHDNLVCGYPTIPESLNGVEVCKIGYGNTPLRLRNCMWSKDKPTLFIELAFDIFAMARICLYLRCSKQSNDDRVILICRNIEEMQMSLDELDLEDTTGSRSSDKLIFCLLDDVMSGKSVFYKVTDDNFVSL